MAVQTQASISIEEISVDQSHHLGLDFSLKQLIIEEHKPSQIYAIRWVGEVKRAGQAKMSIDHLEQSDTRC